MLLRCTYLGDGSGEGGGVGVGLGEGDGEGLQEIQMSIDFSLKLAEGMQFSSMKNKTK